MNLGNQNHVQKRCTKLGHLRKRGVGTKIQNFKNLIQFVNPVRPITNCSTIAATAWPIQMRRAIYFSNFHKNIINF